MMASFKKNLTGIATGEFVAARIVAAYLILFLAFLNTYAVYAQGDKDKKLSAFIDKVLVVAPQLPGLSVVVVDGGHIRFAKGFGMADIDNKIKVSGETGFYIASATKPFTALLAAILAEKGKIDLNKPIIEYRPFKSFKDKTVFNNITVLDLLTHQSGADNSFLAFQLAYSGAYTRESILNLVEKHSKLNAGGKKFKYTNYGYNLFAILLKEELGLDWRDLLKEYIFVPLNMKNSTAYISEAEKKAMALPYIGFQSPKPEISYLLKTDATMHSAGGIISSAKDIGCWLMFELNSGRIDKKQVYPKETILKTQIPIVVTEHRYSKIFKGEGYGLGWRTGTFKNTPLVYHFGSFPGFFSHLSFLPQKKIGVGVLVNHDLGSVIGNLVAEYAYDLYLGDTASLITHEIFLNKELPELIKTAQLEEANQKEKFAKRPWKLTLPKSDYAGSYFNPDLGTITVQLINDQLKVLYGNTKVIATAFTEQDCIRIELVPGSGTVIQFIVSNQQVQEIKYSGMNFIKK